MNPAEPASLLQRFVLDGGVMMVVIIPTAVVALAYMVQGALNLRSSRVAPKGFLADLDKAKRTGGSAAVRQALASSSHSLGIILQATVNHLETRREAEPVVILREEIEKECDLLLHHNSQLAVIFQVAPLLGLLGTVIGMLRAFGSFTSIETLAAGINIALTTTAWGLAIAIPSFLVLSTFRRRVERFELSILPASAAEGLAIIAAADAAEGRRSAGQVP